MSKEVTIIALGIWVLIVPNLGIPGDWRTALLVLSGLATAIIGFLLRGESLARGTRPHAHNHFIESAQPSPMQPHTNHEHQEGIHSLN